MKKASIPAEIRNAVFSLFDCCAACGTWDADECGHIVAEANGGAMVKENFVRQCSSCNRVQATASISFASYATYETQPAVITTRRAYWAKYCGAARHGAPIKAYRPL